MRMFIGLLLVVFCSILLPVRATKYKVAILGASGYTGAELTRLLLNHPNVQIEVLTADRSAGNDYQSIYPQFTGYSDLPKLTKWEDAEDAIRNCDVAFCCLPHGTTQEIILSLSRSEKLKIIDLSADFRLSDVEVYKKWYGKAHGAPVLQKEAVYGLTEVNRLKIKSARLIANPGCYPTAAQLALTPLVKADLIHENEIIIDAKSGTSGAGRSPKESSLFCEVADGIHAYSVASHRHCPEIEEHLSIACRKSVILNFTPHLMPMSRGILETIYVKLKDGVQVDQLKVELLRAYKEEPFVRVLEKDILPQTRHVRGSNFCFINVVADRLPGRAIIVSAIDNLVKGASGQAIQNMNLVLGLPERTALENAPFFP